jgi:hypothetical protein
VDNSVMVLDEDIATSVDRVDLQVGGFMPDDIEVEQAPGGERSSRGLACWSLPFPM